MKIAFLLTQSLESPSGLGRFGPLARGLARLGHDVEVFALQPDPQAHPTRFQDGGVTVEYVAPMHVIKRGSQKRYYSAPRLAAVAAQATWGLTRAALRSEADILHICKPHPMNSVAAWIARAVRRPRLFLDCDDYEAGSGRFNAGWQQRGVALFEKWTPTTVAGVTTNTQFMRQNLLDWGVAPEAITYLPNGIEPARFARPSDARLQALRARLNLVAKRVVIYVGSLSLPSHPVDLLLRAFAALAPRDSDLRLLLVGGGEDLEPLRALAGELGIQEATVFAGRAAPDEVAAYYALAEVSVDPVYDDLAARGRSPLKLFESWACEVPFVSASVGDRPWLAGDPPAALLTAPGDPAALAAGLNAILTQPELAAALRQAGRFRLPVFTFDHLAQDLEAVYLAHLRASPAAGAPPEGA